MTLPVCQGLGSDYHFEMNLQFTAWIPTHMKYFIRHQDS